MPPCRSLDLAAGADTGGEAVVLKLLFIAWLMLPNFMGAVFIYDKFVVREQLQKHGLAASVGSSGNVKKDDKSPSSSPKQRRQGYAPVCLGIPNIWEKILIYIHRYILLLPSYKECSFRKFQTHYSFNEMTLLPLITSTNCD